MKRPARPAASPDLARKARCLSLKNIAGDELAAKLKVTSSQADLLVKVGTLIEEAEALRLKEREFEAFKIIARMTARNTLLGISHTKTGDVDFAGGKHPGWCSRQLVGLVALGLVEMPRRPILTLTRQGWAMAWATGLIKPNWTVPA